MTKSIQLIHSLLAVVNMAYGHGVTTPRSEPALLKYFKAHMSKKISRKIYDVQWIKLFAIKIINDNPVSLCRGENCLVIFSSP